MERGRRAFRIASISLGALLVVAYAAFLLVHNPVDVSGQDSISAGELDNGVEISFAVTDIDTQLLESHFQMRLQTAGDFAGPFGRRDAAGAPLNIEIFGCNCDVQISQGDELPVITGTLPLEVQRSINAWPFDEYATSLEVLVTSGDELVPVSLQPMALTNAGYSLTYKAPEGIDNVLASSAGGAFAEIDASRSDDVKLIVIILSVGVALQLLALVLLAIAGVRGTRHLRLRDEFWITTFLIALPALRSALPGSPPLGIAFDVFFFYWVLLIVACIFVVVLLKILLDPSDEDAKSSTSSVQEADD